jgi:sugar/nucleoside kinase (ribokinase family)
MTASLLIIGGASLDVLHLQNETKKSSGGAGMYTALAAARAGARVTMFAPRPNPMPPELAPLAARVHWIGPIVPPEQLPSFEIAHYGNGKAELVNARWGAEALLTPENLPDMQFDADIVYCGPLADPARQLAFIRHFKTRGFRTAVGTYFRAVSNFRDIVQQTQIEADIFFCNENEARGLWNFENAPRVDAGKILFVTRHVEGADVIQGDFCTRIPTIATKEFDPTGAGDTFCGTTLAHLANGAHPIQAARYGVAAASEMITQLGPTALLAPPPAPAPPRDERVRVDHAQVERSASLIAALPDVNGFDFTGVDFPPLHHPAALDFFFAATLQQFGFWSDDGTRYVEPYIARLNGQPRKGSDYLFSVYMRLLQNDAEALTPARHAALTFDEFANWYRNDDGNANMPALALHFEMARAYGRDMQALRWTPRVVVERANASGKPLQTFLQMLDHIGGYKEDPLRKKATLLAVILRQRPEKFLRVNPDEIVPPMIDYHLQRSCLRTGLIRVNDPALYEKLTRREIVSPDEEWAVRSAAYDAIVQAQKLSGKSMGAVDWFFFQARRRCPEMTDPECARCAVDVVCAHDKKLFQPVMRTTFY